MECVAAAVYDPTKEYGVVDDVDDELSSSSTSSIGRNSDDDDDESLEEEVQSQFQGGGGGGIHSFQDLEEVLPIKRGISNFYSGKSKSFTSLTQATSCSSIKDIGKPENALTRKRKNLLAHNIFWNKNNHDSLRTSTGGISKRTINSRSSASLAAMGHSESNTNSESSNSNSTSPVLSLPPLPPQSRTSSNKEFSASPQPQKFSASPQPQKFSSWRSFSLSDLQGVDAATSSAVSACGGNDDKSGKLD